MENISAQFVKGIRGSDPIVSDGRAQIAFVGRSNVGKSSVINALTGRKNLVRVGDKPGKTKEINFFLVENFFYFVDLPGYGYARVGPKEKEMLRQLILWYLSTPEITPTVVVVVLDAKVGLTEFDQQMLMVLREERHPFVIALNKVDKLSQSELAKQLAKVKAEAQGGEVIPCSATKKDGIQKLFERVTGGMVELHG
jgi:GTP-binding protein